MDKNQFAQPVYVSPAGSPVRTLSNVKAEAAPVIPTPVVRTPAENNAATKNYAQAVPVAADSYKGAGQASVVENISSKSDNPEGKRLVEGILDEIKTLTADLRKVAKLSLGTSAGLAKAEARLEEGAATIGATALEAGGAAAMLVATLVLGDRRLTSSARQEITAKLKGGLWREAGEMYRAAINNWGARLYDNLLIPGAVAAAGQYFIGGSPNFQDPNVWFSGFSALAISTAIGQDVGAKVVGLMPMVMNYFSSNLALTAGIKNLKIKSVVKTGPTTARITFTCERGLFFIKGNEPTIEARVPTSVAPPANSVTEAMAPGGSTKMKGDNSDETLDVTFPAPTPGNTVVVALFVRQGDKSEYTFVTTLVVTP